MQLHHIDGNPTNNKLENLQILCPNCHSQTNNFCGSANKVIKQYLCPDCGRSINKTSRHCLSCASKIKNKNKGKIKLSKEDLLKYKEQG